eukprot:COSAG03_NODE_26_length_19032_cov_87.110812_6_plen_89_part_00
MVAHSVCCTGQRGREKGVQVRELCAGSRAPAVAPNYSAILRLPEQHSSGALNRNFAPAHMYIKDVSTQYYYYSRVVLKYSEYVTNTVL